MKSTSQKIGKQISTTRHQKLRKKVIWEILGESAFFLVLVILTFIAVIDARVPSWFLPFVAVCFLALFLRGFFHLRPMLLDLYTPLEHIKGTVESRREHQTTNPYGGGSHNYYIKLDSLNKEFEVDFGQYHRVLQGDTIELIYHKRSKVVEDLRRE